MKRNKPKSNASIIVILRKILLVSKMIRTSSGERLGIVAVVDMAVEFGFLGVDCCINRKRTLDSYNELRVGASSKPPMPVVKSSRLMEGIEMTPNRRGGVHTVRDIFTPTWSTFKHDSEAILSVCGP